MNAHRPDGTVEKNMAEAKKLRVGLVIGAGAPHSPLMAGALCALLEAGKKFEAVSTSGAGALVGLLYAAPAGGSPTAALRRIVNLGVSEHIYGFFPVGYKAFYKAGPWTRVFRQWAQMCHLPESPIYAPVPPPGNPGPAPMPYPGAGWPPFLSWLAAFWPWLWPPYMGSPGPGHPPLTSEDWRRFYNDWVDFWFAILTPTTLSYASTGLCDPLPFLEEMVDFDALKTFHGQFSVNAYNLNRHKLQPFDKDKITAQHIRAALAMPFIYPPVEVDGEMYYEGADREPLPVEDKDVEANVVARMKGVDKILILDVLSQLECVLMRVPQNIWDAYVISVIAPIVSLATKARPAFETAIKKHVPAVTLEFKIPADVAPHILEWRHGNLARLWDIGYEAGRQFATDPFWKPPVPHRRR